MNKICINCTYYTETIDNCYCMLDGSRCYEYDETCNGFKLRHISMYPVVFIVDTIRKLINKLKRKEES